MSDFRQRLFVFEFDLSERKARLISGLLNALVMFVSMSVKYFYSFKCTWRYFI